MRRLIVLALLGLSKPGGAFPSVSTALKKLVAPSRVEPQLLPVVKERVLILPPMPSLLDRTALGASHAFSDEANWLIPGKVMVGRYPGSDPYLPCTREEQRAGILDLIQRGHIGAFVCLQAEVPSQTSVEEWGPNEEVQWKGTKHGFRLYSRDAIEAAEACGRKAPRFVHVPVEDHDLLNPLSRLHHLVQSIRSLMFKTDGAVYIHCFSGVGRTGMVVACLLGVLYGCTAEEALNHVNSCFRLRGELQTKPHKRSPATKEQIQQVENYFRSYVDQD